MTVEPVARLSRRVLPLLALAAFPAAMDAYGGNRLRGVSPESLAAVRFTFTAAFFIGPALLRGGAAECSGRRVRGAGT